MRTAPLLLVVAAGLTSSLARAQDSRDGHPTLLDRPHTIAEVEAGIIALPNAPISPSNRGGSTPLGAIGGGDATLQTGVHLLYRPAREWAFGAGVLFAPRPTSDTDYFGGASQLPRTHSRSYLFLGGEARYFPIHSRWFEGWFGLTAGALIIADRFTTNSAPPVPSLLGTNQVTVSTEGFSLGAQIGGNYLINESLELGLALRLDRWILPSEKPFSAQTSCDPIGDCPTLTGNAVAFELGITFGYRIPL
ncbi:MAG TPA: hypothetical protein VIF09_06835 [Polyangiaceae bacterium]|jgi:hypothetical protein